MSYENEIDSLEFEWSPECGFFWRIRQGHFVSDDFQRVLSKVSAIDIPEDAAVPRRLVSLLWYIPLFMQWQLDRVRESGGDVVVYVHAITDVTNELERVLGVP